MEDKEQKIEKLLLTNIEHDGSYIPVSAIKKKIPELAKYFTHQSLKDRKDELEKAVQQYIHTTTSNPNNFTEYANNRRDELDKQLKGDE